jgi:selenocysteine lyase/cysteine desulfurase
MLENYFKQFREHVIGTGKTFQSPYGEKEIIYADWTASGRCYDVIEERLSKEIMPLLANTHTETTVTGTFMTKAYEESKQIIKKHVNASDSDVLIFSGSGMTGAVNKLQRILGLRVPERIMDYVQGDRLPDTNQLADNAVSIHNIFSNYLQLDDALKPVVFVTQMEHHSNQTTWLETIATVEIIGSDANGNVDLEHFELLLQKYQHKKNKIAAITGCSNVTGIETPYHQIAKIIHKYGGLCFVDFACSAPYIQINMHPAEEGSYLDAIYFSPHKFLGGPGTPGVLIFNKKIYTNIIPDQPGGGTVVYTNPWKFHEYITDIEHREDGGTPPFLQGIKTAMCIKLKEQMGIDNMLKREKELLKIIFDRFDQLENVEVLEGHNRERLGVVSFIIKGGHFNFIVKVLNDKFGIQTRGGCACAGTYGHILLHVDEIKSYEVLNSIHGGDLSCKPGWIRLSIHPTMTNEEIVFIMDSIEETAKKFIEWQKEYVYNPESNEFACIGFANTDDSVIRNWYSKSFV